MARQIQLRQGNTAEHNTFTGALGEITYDTNKKVVVTHDGVTVGGWANAARANPDGTISLIKKDGGISGTISDAGLFYGGFDSTAQNQATTPAVAKFLNDRDNNLQDQITSAYNQQFGNVGILDVTGQRARNITYWNTSGRPMLVVINCGGAAGGAHEAYVGGVLTTRTVNNDQYITQTTMTFLVPQNLSYSVNGSPISRWVEYR